jgi:hypothetical protein
VKLPTHRVGPFDRAHGPEYVEWASLARSGEPKASKGNIVLIVPLYPAYPALAGRGTFRSRLNTVDPFGGAKPRPSGRGVEGC